MIIIGEKINGAIPSVKQAIAEHDEGLIRERTRKQAAAGAHYLDCAPSTATEIEYETMCWLIDVIFHFVLTVRTLLCWPVSLRNSG